MVDLILKLKLGSWLLESLSPALGNDDATHYSNSLCHSYVYASMLCILVSLSLWTYIQMNTLFNSYGTLLHQLWTADYIK